MRTASLVLAAFGACVTTAAAIWLLIGFRPDNTRYTDSGPIFPGSFKLEGVSRLLRDQGRVAALVLVGSVLQLLAVALGFLA